MACVSLIFARKSIRHFAPATSSIRNPCRNTSRCKEMCYNRSNFHAVRLIRTSNTALDSVTVSGGSETRSDSQPQYSEKVTTVFDKMKMLDSIEVNLLAELVREKIGFDIDPNEFGATKGSSSGGGAASVKEVKEEKVLFDLKLTAFDAKSKIKVIKEVRAITSAGLKEAKDMVEGAPKVLKKDMKKEEAEELKAKLEAVGATVEIV